VSQESYELLLESGQSEISVKLEFNNLSHTNRSEESKIETKSENIASVAVPLSESSGKSEETFLIQYRYLNSINPEEIHSLRIPGLDITLEDLSNLVLQSNNKTLED